MLFIILTISHNHIYIQLKAVLPSNSSHIATCKLTSLVESNMGFEFVINGGFEYYISLIRHSGGARILKRGVQI